jgi:peptidoglycan/LPS O-acetylase OafA/YrhL
VDPTIVAAAPAEPPSDAVVLPGEMRERKKSHRRPRYRLAQACCILSAAGSATALVGMALEEAPLAQVSAGFAVLTAVAALAFAWRSRMKSRVVEWALAAGAVAILIAAAVVVLGDGPRNTEPQGKPTTVSPGQRQQQG